jgi:type IV pilus assembly protein PilB
MMDYLDLGEDPLTELFGDTTGVELDVDIPDDEEFEESPVVKVINGILSESIRQSASHIHLEPSDAGYRIRYRVDGLLREAGAVPSALCNAAVSRVKILSNLDIAERRLPQDGRIAMSIADVHVEWMVSTHPTQGGERIAMRLLTQQSRIMDIEDLGLLPPDLQKLKSALGHKAGVLLVAGSRGSGRTTTLYATLNHLKNSQVSLLTAEDPVECTLEGVGQSQIKSEIGFTYAAALRSIMRQDPDAIMVSALSDPETTGLVMQMGQDGYLLLSAVESESACDALFKLVEQGISATQVGSAVRLVLAQKLVRKNCPACSHHVSASVDELNLCNAVSGGSKRSLTLSRGAGCDACGGSGYRGRLPVCESLFVSRSLCEMLSEGAPLETLQAAAIQGGMEPLSRNAMRHVLEGRVSLEEFMRNFPEVESL